MRMKNVKRSIALLAIVLSISSCVDGFKDDQEFSSDVRNTTLESPKAEDIVITTVANVTGGQDLKFSWPVVHGAGGYEFTLYNVDNPENPVVIGEENEVIDGCYVQRERAEDTKYKVVVRTLGNKKLNNQEAEEATELAYSNLVPVYQTIPTGTDLTTYFTTNPIEMADVSAEIVYELEPNGEYTMTGNVDLGMTNVTLRGDKIHRAKITVTGSSSFVSDGAGFRIRWSDLDLTNYSGSAFIQYRSTINEANPRVIYYNETDPWIVVEAESGIESSKITGLSTTFIKDNGKKYALRSFSFKDCVVEQNTADAIFIDFTGALIKDLLIVNSTLYNLQKSTAYWTRYANVRVVQVADRKVWATETGSIKILNSTLYNVAYGKDIFNSNGWGQKSNTVTINNSIIVDCGKQEVLRRLRASTNNVTGIFENNTYWYDGVFSEPEITHNQGDKTGSELRDDPSFVGAANGDFTVQGAAQLEKRTGDPRWLPAQ